MGLAEAQQIIDVYADRTVADAIEALVEGAAMRYEDADNLVRSVLYAGRMAGRAETLTIVDEAPDFDDAVQQLTNLIEAELVVADLEEE